jgi:hypothetical protein
LSVDVTFYQQNKIKKTSMLYEKIKSLKEVKIKPRKNVTEINDGRKILHKQYIMYKICTVYGDEI